jgi:hypothetical protein
MENENNRHYPFGRKEAEGFAARGVHDVNHVSCPAMPGGITGAPLNSDPHARGFKMPVHIAPETRRPVGKPAAMTPPHNPDPHPYNPSSSVKLPNTYAKPAR